MAAFHVDVFDMEGGHRKGGVYLSDSYMSLAILPHRTLGEMAPGLNRFGFTVDSVEEIAERMMAHGVDTPTLRPAHRPLAEHRGADPYGNGFDRSEYGYQEVEYRAERGKRKEEATV